jgi:hypothetical protein
VGRNRLHIPGRPSENSAALWAASGGSWNMRGFAARVYMPVLVLQVPMRMCRDSLRKHSHSE